MPVKCPTEAQEQVALARWMSNKGILFVHVPNEGKRSPMMGALLKRMGMKPGCPDLLILSRPRRLHKRTKWTGVAIEMKRVTGGRLTEAQDQWLEDLKRAGWQTKVACGAKEAAEFLVGLGY
jgi:hypothetical protein